MCAEVAQKEKCAFVSHGCTVRLHHAVEEINAQPRKRRAEYILTSIREE